MKLLILGYLFAVFVVRSTAFPIPEDTFLADISDNASSGSGDVGDDGVDDKTNESAIRIDVNSKKQEEESKPVRPPLAVFPKRPSTSGQNHLRYNVLTPSVYSRYPWQPTLLRGGDRDSDSKNQPQEEETTLITVTEESSYFPYYGPNDHSYDKMQYKPYYNQNYPMNSNNYGRNYGGYGSGYDGSYGTRNGGGYGGGYGTNFGGGYGTRYGSNYGTGYGGGYGGYNGFSTGYDGFGGGFGNGYSNLGGSFGGFGGFGDGFFNDYGNYGDGYFGNFGGNYYGSGYSGYGDGSYLPANYRFNPNFPLAGYDSPGLLYRMTGFQGGLPIMPSVPRLNFLPLPIK